MPPAGLFGVVLQGLHDKRVPCKTATFFGVHRKKSGRLCKDSEASRNTRAVVVFSRKSRPDRVSCLSGAGGVDSPIAIFMRPSSRASVTRCGFVATDRDLHATAFAGPCNHALRSQKRHRSSISTAYARVGHLRPGQSRGSKSYTLHQNDRSGEYCGFRARSTQPKRAVGRRWAGADRRAPIAIRAAPKRANACGRSAARSNDARRFGDALAIRSHVGVLPLRRRHGICSRPPRE